MNIHLNRDTIKKMCGTVSLKRGDSLRHANKVIFNHYSPDRCEATVTATEQFHVVIDRDFDGFRATCNCPTLASVASNCQHVAAVLLTIYEHQRQGSSPTERTTASKQELANGLLNLFNKRSKRSSGHQLFFENRLQLEVIFIIKPIPSDGGQNLFGIGLKIGSAYVGNIREFLEQVGRSRPSKLSDSFTYNPHQHCFQKETDAVIQQLIPFTYDDNVYSSNHRILPITPSSWERLAPLLANAPSVRLEVDEMMYVGFRLSRDHLPIQFNLHEVAGGNYTLHVKNLNRMLVFAAYQAVLTDGWIFQLSHEDCGRLLELQQMLASSASEHIPIPHDQIDAFLGQVVPELRKLGDVQLSDAISRRMLKRIPLVAKLYLDRVKDRLLAGLEFHYDHMMINPLEDREPQIGGFVRDTAKEQMILQWMAESQFAQTESGYYLHNEELEYEFLYHIVPRLQEHAQIYATTAVRNRIFKGSARPRIRVKIHEERTNWLEFKFEMDGIPEQQIRGILLALEEKRKYYRLRNGSLLSLTSEEFEEINRFLNEMPTQNEDLVNGMDVPVVRGLLLLDTSKEDHIFALDESFRQFLNNIHNPGQLRFEVPGSLAPILRDYQEIGFQWMKILASYGFGGILADDMGLGKTLQSLAYIVSVLPSIRTDKHPVLVVCPSSLTYNWLSEIKKFSPEIRAVIIDGSMKERVNKQRNALEFDVIITSYPLLRRDIKWYEGQVFHTVFYDEAQAFKNPFTQTAKAVNKLRSQHHFALTGTPVENSLEELWSIFHVVFPELFHGYKEYSNLTRQQIARRVRPFLLRRMKVDVLAELPVKMESMESADLLPEQKKLYAAYLAKLRHDTLKHLDKETLSKNRIKILAGLTRLRQICCHPALFVDGYKGSSAKFEQLMQIIRESSLSGRRVLIFSQFTKMLRLIGRELAFQGLPYFYLDGQTSSEERLKRCDRFNTGERDFFLISLKAGGTGLNLTAADTVILYDLWWNPAVEDQAADRAHRIGQTQAVQVIKLVARGTIEEKMNELQEKKRQLIGEIIDSRGLAPVALTEEDIREILMV